MVGTKFQCGTHKCKLSFCVTYKKNKVPYHHSLSKISQSKLRPKTPSNGLILSNYYFVMALWQLGALISFEYFFFFFFTLPINVFIFGWLMYDHDGTVKCHLCGGIIEDPTGVHSHLYWPHFVEVGPGLAMTGLVWDPL